MGGALKPTDQSVLLDNTARAHTGGLGLVLDPLEACVVATSDVPALPSSVMQFERICLANDAIPPAVLLPACAEEPLRFDAGWPPHPRGTGADWPPEARLEPDRLSGRFPLAYAWQELTRDDGGRAWSWTQHGHDSQVVAAEAIAAAVDAVKRAVGLRAEAADPVLVIPNHLTTAQQQELLDAALGFDAQPRLLWRPIAAALEWCRVFGDQFQSSRAGQPVGQLLVLHLGIDEWEFTSLELVTSQDSPRRLLPARRRPRRKEERLASFGVDLLTGMAARSLHLAGAPVTGQSLWQRLWCTSWASRVLRQLSVPPVEATSLDPHATALQAHFAQLLPALAGQLPTPVALPFRSRLLEWTGGPSLQHWQQALAEAGAVKGLLGVIVTGPLAGLQAAGGTSFAEIKLRKVDVPGDRVLIEGLDRTPPGVLARGAAEFGLRLARQEETYLDTLPRMRAVVRVGGKPRWADLLKDDEGFVPGGQEWKCTPKLGNLSIHANASSLRLAVHHEEHTHVREVEADLSRVKIEKAESVSLLVSMTPAAGQARIEVLPATERLFGGQRVFLDIRERGGTATNTNKSPEEYLKDLPCSFPDLLPRGSSIERWRAARFWLTELKQGLSKHDVASRLEKAKDCLRTNDPQQGGHHTAVSSDGDPPAVMAGAEELLLSIVGPLADSLSKSSGALFRARNLVLRVLAYCSPADERLQAYLRIRIAAALKSRSSVLDEAELACIGGALREERAIAGFCELFCCRLSRQLTGSNNWLKAMAELLRYRETATRECSDELCERAVAFAFRVFQSEMEDQSLKYLFRNAMLTIVYLLRRRAWSDSFLDPSSQLAVKLKTEFKQVAAKIDANKLSTIRGSVDLPKQLKLMIDFIDRKGKGDFLSLIEVGT